MIKAADYVRGVELHDVTGEIVIDERAMGEWCQKPYGKQENGCPNYNDPEHSECPPFDEPNGGIISSFINLNKEHWFWVIEFDIGGYDRKNKELHPDWSDKQRRNSIRWQGHLTKRLRIACETFMPNQGLVFTFKPEGRGVHVIKSAQNIGIPIKARHKDTIFKIALIGHPTIEKKDLKKLFKKRRKK